MEEKRSFVETDDPAAANFSVECVECVEVVDKNTWPPTEAEIEEFLEAIRRSRHLPCGEIALKK